MFLTLFSMILGFSPSSAPKALLEAIAAHGGMNHFYSMRDVEYKLTSIDFQTGVSSLSSERYIFENEQSYGRSEDREEFFDGKETYSAPPSDPQVRWRRKRNYFLFSIPFKFLDKGFHYKERNNESINGQDYRVVELTVTEGVGDASDRFVVYINSRSKLIDRLLYTDYASKQTHPTLLMNTFEEVSGIHVATKRVYFPANASGIVTGGKILEEHLDQIRFWNGFTRENLLPKNASLLERRQDK